MTEAATLDGERVSSCVIHLPPVGPWWADVVMEEAPDVSGQLDLVIGGATLRGTVIPGSSGVFAERGQVRFVAGAGAWGALLPARQYHNDAGVTALQVATDAANEASEVLGDFTPEADVLGIDFVRESGAASLALGAAIGSAQWWVGVDGITRVGPRSTTTPTAGSFELLEFDPISRLATIALDDLSALSIGSILPADTRLAAAQTIREMRIEASADALRVIAWCGDVAGTRSREAVALDRIVSAIIDRRLLVPREYRVLQMNGDRVDLQSTASGVSPDLQAISFRGMAGVSAQLVVGTLVIVQWINGDRARPMITHAVGKDGSGWSPVSLTLDAIGASASIKAGAGATETLAWASKLLAELIKISTTLNSLAGAAFGTPYVPPVSVTTLGTAKTVAQ